MKPGPSITITLDLTQEELGLLGAAVQGARINWARHSAREDLPTEERRACYQSANVGTVLIEKLTLAIVASKAKAEVAT